MLVLSRKIGETITIGDDIRITVIQVIANKIRIGISAPEDVPVHRLEVYQTLRAEAKAKARAEAAQQQAERNGNNGVHE